jgi:ABC-type cobalt transport system substrate-binding protein
MDKDKALKLALEFVENVHLGEWQGSTERQEEVVTVINKALAQPAQKPVYQPPKDEYVRPGALDFKKVKSK